MIYIVTNKLKQIRIIKPIFSFIELFKSESKFKIFIRKEIKKFKIKIKKHLIKMKNHLHNPLSAELNFCYLSYSAYLISRLAFFLVSIDYNCCFELRGKVADVESISCVFFCCSALEKITCTEIYESQNKNATK